MDRLDLPPGPSTSESVEVLGDMQRDPISTLTSLVRKHGRRVHFMLGPLHVYFFNSPEYVKLISVVNHDHFVKNQGGDIQSSSGIYEALGVKGNQMLEDLIAHGILLSEGDRHDSHRRVMQPAFGKNQISSYAPIVVDLTGQWSERMKDGDKISVRKEMIGLTLGIVLKALFSVEGGEARAFADAIGEVGRAGEKGFQSPKFSSGRRQYEKSKGRLDELAFSLITKRKKRGAPRADLLDTLLFTRDRLETANLSDVEVRDEILTIIMAGFTTVASALTWTWYLLSQYSEAEDKLHEELDRVLGGRQPVYEDIPKLVYTTMVFNESLRLYPPIWLERRRCVKELTLDGQVIPQGSVVLTSQYVMHHDPEYFPDPEKFDPERWSPERRPAIPTFAYFPFGVGPRACLGEPFAKLEGPLIIARIAQQWRLELLSQGPIGVEPYVTLQPKSPVMMRLKTRWNT